jgi:hypothetical protein
LSRADMRARAPRARALISGTCSLKGWRKVRTENHR